MYHNSTLITEQKPKDVQSGNPQGRLYLGVSSRNIRYEHYQGFLDELVIYNQELTVKEIQTIHRANAFDE